MFIVYLLLGIGIIFLLYTLLNKKNNIEHYVFPYIYWPIFQYWNMPLRSTRNMSYDIRGDPVPPIPRTYVGPWLNSTIM